MIDGFQQTRSFVAKRPDGTIVKLFLWQSIVPPKANKLDIWKAIRTEDHRDVRKLERKGFYQIAGDGDVLFSDDPDAPLPVYSRHRKLHGSVPPAPGRVLTVSCCPDMMRRAH